MNPPQAQEVKGQPEVPAQIFEEFLIRLEKADTPTDVVERLRATIITKKDLSDKAIRAALFPEEESDD
jgi:hypothetical protein